MTLGVGGSTADQEMAGLSRQTGFIPISPDERQGRIANAQRLMVEQGIDALYLMLRRVFSTLLVFACGLPSDCTVP